MIFPVLYSYEEFCEEFSKHNSFLLYYRHKVHKKWSSLTFINAQGLELLIQKQEEVFDFYIPSINKNKNTKLYQLIAL